MSPNNKNIEKGVEKCIPESNFHFPLNAKTAFYRYSPAPSLDVHQLTRLFPMPIKAVTFDLKSFNY